MPVEVKWGISLLVGLGLLGLGWKFYFCAHPDVLYIMICAVLIIVVLTAKQRGRGFWPEHLAVQAAKRRLAGVARRHFLTKATTWCAIMFMMTSMALTMRQNSSSASSGSSVLQQFSKTSKQAMPTVPVPTMPAPAVPVPATPNAATPAPGRPGAVKVIYRGSASGGCDFTGCDQ